MNRAIFFLPVFLAALSLINLATATLVASARAEELAVEGVIRCWQNHEGIQECGSAVPPEFVQQGHKSIDKLGNVREEVRPAPTEEERAALDAAKQKQAEQEALIKEAKKKDQALLQTFSRVEDIQQSLDDKLAVLRGNIALLKKRNEVLSERLELDLATAVANEQSGEQLSENLRAAIATQREQLGFNEETIKDYGRQIEELRAAYAVDIARFKVLKAEKDSGP